MVPSTKKSLIDPNDLPAVEWRTLGRILAYLGPYRGRAGLALACMLGGALLGLVPPLLVKRVVDESIPSRDLRELWFACGAMIAAAAVAGVLSVAQRYTTAWIGERVVVDLRLEVYRQLQRQPLAYFTRARPGEALSHVLNDVQGVRQVVSTTLVQVAENALVLVSTTALCVALDFRLALLALGLLPIFVVPTRRVGRRRKTLKRETQAKMAEMTGILSETLSVSGALTTKVYGAEAAEAARLEEKAREVMTLSLQQTLVGRWFQMLLALFESAGPALIFAGGGWLIVQGELGLGTVVAFVTVLKRLYGPARQLAGVHVDVVTSYAYFDRIFAVIDLEPSVSDQPGARPLVDPRGEIELRGVTFTHGGESQALLDVSLSVPAGSMVAIVGASGAGKSSLCALVPRLCDPDRGQVLVDGADVRDYTLESLRAAVGLVTQEAVLFNASVRENLRFARPGASDAEIEAAARAAQVHELITAMPAGYDTVVGDRGYRLSGGERQRLAIARALLKDPRILILDEATSAVDSLSEALIQEAIARLCEGRTSLVIAHRLSTVRRADLIVVLEAGRVVERGRHDELLAAGGQYARLWAGQALPAAAQVTN